MPKCKPKPLYIIFYYNSLEIVEKLLTISKHLIMIINSLLNCYQTREITCYTIGLFGQINVIEPTNNSSARKNKQQYWHPILEIYDIVRRIEVAKLPGTNQNIEKHIYGIHI